MFGTSSGSSTHPAAPRPLNLLPCVHSILTTFLVVCRPGPGWRTGRLFIQVGLVRICPARFLLHLVCRSLSRV